MEKLTEDFIFCALFDFSKGVIYHDTLNFLLLVIIWFSLTKYPCVIATLAYARDARSSSLSLACAQIFHGLSQLMGNDRNFIVSIDY